MFGTERTFFRGPMKNVRKMRKFAKSAEKPSKTLAILGQLWYHTVTGNEQEQPRKPTEGRG